jgi:hypothetical protein
MADVNVIDKVTYACNHTQSVYHTVIATSGDSEPPSSLRIRIRRNAYDSSSYVAGDLWCVGNGWKEVFEHPIHIYPGLPEVSRHGSLTEALSVLEKAAAQGFELLTRFAEEE